MTSMPRSSERTASGSLAEIRDLTIVVALFLYFAAFLYIRIVFHDLGVDVGLIDIPVFTMFIYALEPLESWTGIVLLVIVFIGGALGSLIRDGQSRSVATVAMLAILFFGLQYVAVTQAHVRSDQLRRGHGRPLTFTVRDPDKVKLSPWLEARRSLCDQYVNDPRSTTTDHGRTVMVTCPLLFVAETVDTVYAYSHIPDLKQDPLTAGQLIELRKQDLVSWAVHVDP